MDDVTYSQYDPNRTWVVAVKHDGNWYEWDRYPSEKAAKGSFMFTPQGRAIRNVHPDIEFKIVRDEGETFEDRWSKISGLRISVKVIP